MTTAPLHYVALGDSAGVGIGARDGRSYVHRVHERLPAARLTNLCTNGATSATVRERQLARAVAAKPDLVTLFIGGNDLWKGGDAAWFGRNLDAIAASLSTLSAPIITGTIGNLAHAPAAAFAEQMLGLPRTLIESRVRSLNAEIERVSRTHGWALVDLFGVGLADAPQYFSPDGFHPSSEGYAVWAEALWPAVERAVAARAA